MDGVVLFGFIQIPQAGGYHIGSLPKLVIILHLAAVGLQGVVEKLGLDPAGVHSHHPDAAALQLPVGGAGVAEDEGFGGAIGGDVGDGLEGRQAVQLQNVAAGVHIRQGQPCDGYQRLAVQVDHPQVIFQRHILECAEFAKTGGIDQQTDIGLFFRQKLAEGGKTGAVAQIQGNGADGNGGVQRAQGIFPTGDGPNFVHLHIVGQLQDKLPAHTGGCAGDNGNIHRMYLLNS